MSFRSLSFRFYFPVLVVALAGAVFGLGAIFGLGVVKPSSSPPAKAVAAETKFTTEPKVVQKKSPVEQATSSSALSPIYPTKPGAPRADESAAPPAAQADKAAPRRPRGADEAAAKSAARTDERAKPSGVAAPPAAEASAAAKVTEAAPPPDKPSARARHPSRDDRCGRQRQDDRQRAARRRRARTGGKAGREACRQTRR